MTEAGDDCQDELQVKLDEPVGDRVLVDALTGDPVPRAG